MKRGDLAKQRYLATASVYMADSMRSGLVPPVAAATYGMCKTHDEAEHGGIGIGAGTCRRARREFDQWLGDLLRMWATKTIGQGA